MIGGLVTLIAVGILFFICYCIFIIPIKVIKSVKTEIKNVQTEIKNREENKLIFEELIRFPNKYIGQCVRLSGKISWVIEERINENYTKYTMVLCVYDRKVYLQMKLDNKTERIIEGDYVTIEGIYENTYNGTPILWVNKFWR